MKRRIIHIDEEKCNGCGLCADACHEGAIGMVEGKAKLLREDYCDGLGDCLPACPAGAISFEKREADPYDEKAVMENKQRLQEKFQKKIQRPGSRICLSHFPAQTVAGPDQAGSCKCTVLPGGKAADRSRLYSLCLWGFS